MLFLAGSVAGNEMLKQENTHKYVVQLRIFYRCSVYVQHHNDNTKIKHKKCTYDYKSSFFSLCRLILISHSYLTEFY